MFACGPLRTSGPTVADSGEAVILQGEGRAGRDGRIGNATEAAGGHRASWRARRIAVVTVRKLRATPPIDAEARIIAFEE